MSQVKQRQGRIPTFASIEDEAAFWDSHNLGDFEDELEAIEPEVVRPLVHRLTVDLESDRLRCLATIAKQRGVTPTALACRWVLQALERVDAEPDTDPSPSGAPV